MNKEQPKQPKQPAKTHRVRVKTMPLTTPQELSATEAKKIQGGVLKPAPNRIGALPGLTGDDDGYGIGGGPNQ